MNVKLLLLLLLLIWSLIIILYIHKYSSNDDDDDIPISLSIFLSKYNKSTLIKYIRNIESSIFFDKITSNNKELNKLYQTGISPHFYNGEFSFIKTCKHLKFAYLCPGNITVKKGEINKWTLRINESLLEPQTLKFLHILQTQYNLYTNVYLKLIDNMQKLRSPFIKKSINILFWGNSHLRQIFEGLQCIIDDIEYNIFHHITNEIILKYKPLKHHLFKTKEIINVTYDNTFCFGLGHGEIQKWNKRDWNGLNLNKTLMNKLLDTQLKDKNMKSCKSDQVFIKLKDKTNLYYKFIHDIPFKLISENGFNKYLNNSYNNNEFDIIIFNIGNDPVYKYQTKLAHDLYKMKHFKKPIIMLSTFHGNSKNDRILWDKQILNKILYQNQPFKQIIYVNLHERIHKKLWNETLNNNKLKYLLAGNNVFNPKHFCQPGLIEHLSLALLELINLLLALP